MKKVLATILAFVYLSSSLGATIHLHYCMGKLSSWSLIDHESKNCASCGMVKKMADFRCVAEKMNCCKDEHKHIQAGQDQKSFTSEFFKYTHSTPQIALQEMTNYDLSVFSEVIGQPRSNGPPLQSKLPRFILFCNFRI